MAKEPEAQEAQVSEAQIAVHWPEEEYHYPPAKFIAQANAADPAIFERFREEHFPDCFKEYADLLLVEAANALWKKTARKELSAREADRALGLLGESGLDLRPTALLLGRAMALARRLRHPVYDCVYLALAERERAALVTADARLLRRFSGRKVAPRVVDLATL